MEITSLIEELDGLSPTLEFAVVLAGKGAGYLLLQLLRDGSLDWWRVGILGSAAGT